MLFKVDDKIEDLFKTQLSLPQHTLQRTSCDVFDMLEFFPRNVENVIDLGCGSGRVSIGLSKTLLNPIKYWLVDCEDSSMEKHWGQYCFDGETRFYNKRELTEHFCKLNGLQDYQYVVVDKKLNWSEIPPKADVLFSKYAIGWHFPIKTYEHIYPKILKEGAVCFFTWQIKKTTTFEYYVENLPSYFKVLKIYKDSFPFQRNKTMVLRYG